MRSGGGEAARRRDSVSSVSSMLSVNTSVGVAPKARMRIAPGVGSFAGVRAPLLPGVAGSEKQRPGGRCRLYGRMAVCFVGSMLSSGVLVSFPTLEPILLDQREGVVRRSSRTAVLSAAFAAPWLTPTRHWKRRVQVCLRRTASTTGQRDPDPGP